MLIKEKQHGQILSQLSELYAWRSGMTPFFPPILELDSPAPKTKPEHLFVNALKDALLLDVEGESSGNIWAIPLSQRYLEIEQELIASENDGVTVFYGGPLDYRCAGIHDAWLTPVEVRDNQGFTNFHVIYVNCDGGKNIKNARIVFDTTPEISLKLAAEDKGVEKLSKLLHCGNNKVVVIRPSLTGSLAYPLISTPIDVPDENVLRSRTRRALSQLHIPYPLIRRPNFSKEKLLVSPVVERAEYEHFTLMEPLNIRSKVVGDVLVHRVYAKDDPWRYYEIFSFQDIHTIINKEHVIMRLDSGCDIGMLYGDEGCDCHPQLLRALQTTREDGGIIVHIPTQDGRGYGMNTKAETEGHKRGTPVVFNQGMPEMKTLEAAKLLFGKDSYDIRSYQGVGRMLSEIGFRSISMITDNKRKVQQVIAGGSAHSSFSVTRVGTNTIENGDAATCLVHVEEKHASDDYFS